MVKHKWDGTGESKGFGFIRFTDKGVERQVKGGGSDKNVKVFVSYPDLQNYILSGAQQTAPDRWSHL